MRMNYKHILNSYQYRIGSGFVNNLITKLPIELHLQDINFVDQAQNLQSV